MILRDTAIYSCYARSWCDDVLLCCAFFFEKDRSVTRSIQILLLTFNRGTHISALKNQSDSFTGLNYSSNDRSDLPGSSSSKVGTL